MLIYKLCCVYESCQKGKKKYNFFNETPITVSLVCLFVFSFFFFSICFFFFYLISYLLSVLSFHTISLYLKHFYSVPSPWSRTHYYFCHISASPSTISGEKWIVRRAFCNVSEIFEFRAFTVGKLKHITLRLRMI